MHAPRSLTVTSVTAQTGAPSFLVRAKQALDAAPPHLNPAIALYVKLKPQVGRMTLLDLQLHAAEMEETARAGATEAETVKQLVAALDALTPEPVCDAPVGF